MAENHEAPEAGKLLRAWTRGRRETERAAQRDRSWTVQNKMRGVRWRCERGSRFCQSLRDKSLTVSCVHCGENERAHSKRDEGAQVLRWKSRNLCVKKFR